MKSSQSLIERSMKLLRLAAPGSGTTDAERTSAALEAARIISENNFVVAEKQEEEKKRKKAPAAAADDGFYSKSRQWARKAPVHVPMSDFDEVVVFGEETCMACKGVIFDGETAWFDSRYGYRHYDITCDSE